MDEENPSDLRQQNQRLQERVDHLEEEIREKDEDGLRILKSVENLRAFLDHLPAHVYIKDENLRHHFANQYTLDFVGKSYEEFIGTTLYDIFPKEIADEIAAADRKVLETDSMVERIGPSFSLHGKRKWERDIKFPLKGVNGEKLIGGIGIDTTELVEARIRAEEASRSKSDFVALMSHELRTPLGPILGFAEMLLSKNKYPEIRSEIQKILDSARDLFTMIEDILRVTASEGLEDEPRMAVFEIIPHLRRVFDLVSGRFAEKSLDTTFSVSDDFPKFIYQDQEKIQGILLILLKNAFAFTKNGSVHLSLSVDDGLFCVNVLDTGKGIAPENLEKIFHPFFQIENPSIREVGGAGLGLSIAKHMANSINGELSVQSVPDQGSCFTLAFPEQS